MDENIQGKYFSITDPENVNTVIREKIKFRKKELFIFWGRA